MWWRDDAEFSGEIRIYGTSCAEEFVISVVVGDSVAILAVNFVRELWSEVGSDIRFETNSGEFRFRTHRSWLTSENGVEDVPKVFQMVGVQYGITWKFIENR